MPGFGPPWAYRDSWGKGKLPLDFLPMKYQAGTDPIKSGRHQNLKVGIFTT